MKKLGFVLIMVLTAFFLMGCPNPVREVEELPTEEEVLEMYKDWYISNSNEQANLRSSESESTEYTVEYFIETISKFSVNVKNCHLKYAKGENSLELWLEDAKLMGLLNLYGYDADGEEILFHRKIIYYNITDTYKISFIDENDEEFYEVFPDLIDKIDNFDKL